LELDQWALAEALWSPDGNWFLHRTFTDVQGAGDILGRRKGRDTTLVPIVATRFTELAPALSPNGRWLACSSTETGRNEVFVAPFPNAGDSKWPVSVGGGTEPLWSRDGREIFYRNGKGEMAAVRVETQAAFSMGATRVLFPDTNYLRLSAHRQYDATAAGERFILIRPVGAGRASRLILVQNFLEELKRIAPNWMRSIPGSTSSWKAWVIWGVETPRQAGSGAIQPAIAAAGVA
jgi:serine/threonine-protein kinase